MAFRALTSLGENAMSALVAALDDVSAPHGIRIKAANSALTHESRMKEVLTLDALAQRLAQVEDVLRKERLSPRGAA